MSRLSIRHETLCRHGQAARLGPQRLMVRPRDSHADRLLEASLKLLPREAHSIFGGVVDDPRPCEMFVSVDVRMMVGPPQSAAA
jgi:hypothetical protein